MASNKLIDCHKNGDCDFMFFFLGSSKQPDTTLLWVSRKTLAKSEVDQINNSRENWRHAHAHTRAHRINHLLVWCTHTPTTHRKWLHWPVVNLWKILRLLRRQTVEVQNRIWSRGILSGTEQDLWYNSMLHNNDILTLSLKKTELTGSWNRTLVLSICERIL